MVRHLRIVFLPLAGLLTIVLAACGAIAPDSEFLRQELGPKVREEVSKRADQLADHVDKLEEGLPLPEEPAAMPIEDTGPWLTALDAAAVAVATSAGVPSEVSGHVALAQGAQTVGDRNSVVPSPGPGYGLEWWVGVQKGQRTLSCTVTVGQASCEEVAQPASSADMGAVTQDSTEVFPVVESDPRWVNLVGNENVSVLLNLHPDIDQEGQYVWSASVTVHDADISPSNGYFHWKLRNGNLDVSVN